MKRIQNNNLVAIDFKFKINKVEYIVIGVHGWMLKRESPEWQIKRLSGGKVFVYNKAKLDKKLRENKKDNNHLMF